MSQRFKSLRESGVSTPPTLEPPADVLKAGTLKKLKKMKRKFFVLRKGSQDTPSKLEYYPSEKKWRLGCEPKRSIPLKSCFNISRKLHPKHKYVICLYTLEDCFSIILENEEELNEWLSSMLELQLNEVDADEDGKFNPVYEHVWQVIVDDRELEFSRDLSGPYCLGLTSKSLSLVKISPNSENFESLEFPLMSIRRCGHSGKHFFIELGRSAITGAGGVWMETEGTVVAQNMHETILGAMKSSRNKEELGPHSRPRSASTSENSKPIATRRPVGVVLPQPTLTSTLANSREHCNTVPPRAQTISESLHDVAYSYNPGSLSASIYSNGSNISFEDQESPQPNHLSWCSYSQSGDSNFMIESSIREAPNEYLMMSPTDDNMNIIPKKSDYLNMNPCSGNSVTGGSDNDDTVGYSPQSPNPLDYMDMKSPTNTEGYIPMSVLGSVNADSCLIKRHSSNSLSETIEKGKDGYVSMAPCGASEETSVPMQEGYLSMSPLSSSLPKQINNGAVTLSSPDGSCSTLEGDSTEFKLDKVQSLLKHNDDDEDFIKPARAYSIGNRKEIYEARARAYSMGSERARPEVGVSVSPPIGNLKEANCAAKSCSAPVLQDSPSVTQKIAGKPVKDFGNDLMEIDYNKVDEHVPVTDCENSDYGAKKLISKSRLRTVSRSSCSTLPLLSLDEVNERPVSEGSEEVKSKVLSELNDSKQHEKHPAAKEKVPVDSVSNYVEMSHTSKSGNSNVKKGALLHTSEDQRSNTVMKTCENGFAREGSSPGTSVQNVGCHSAAEMKLNLHSVVEMKLNLHSVAIPTATATSSAMQQVQCFTVKSSEVQERKHSLDKSELNSGLLLSRNSCTAKMDSPTLVTKQWKSKSLRDNRSTSQSISTLDAKTAGCQGEYVNLMLSKPRHVSPPPLLQSSPKVEIQKRSSVDTGNLTVTSSIEPDYMNIKLGKPYTPLPNPALVSSTHPQLTVSESMKENIVASLSVNAVQTTSSSDGISRWSPIVDSSATSTNTKCAAVKPKAFCMPSLPAIRKQMSAPAVSPSLQPELVSPGRKSSCPVTASASMVKSMSPANSHRLVSLPSVATVSGFLKLASSRSPDHNTDSSHSDLSTSSQNSNPKLANASTSATASQQNLSDTQYENVTLPVASSSSRPPSVSSEKELNYASLDLAPAASAEAPHSPAMLKLSHQATLDDDEPLTYAEIDFTKSEGLRHTSGAFREGRL